MNPNKIQIEIIPHCSQKYETYGNYWLDKKGVLQIRISCFRDWRHEMMIMVHELVEALCCIDKGISMDEITKFDLKHLDAEDPGCLKSAPYHKEHMNSLAIERLMCKQHGINFKKYYNTKPVK